MNDTNKNIQKLNRIFALVFLAIILYIAYLQFFAADRLHTMASDPRMRENIANRGIIYSADMKELAVNRQDKKDKENWYRFYPYSDIMAQIIGYDNLIYGKTGLEDHLNNYLAFDNKMDSILKVKLFLDGKSWNGFDCVTTIRENVQTKAYESIKNYKAAVVVLNPKTGEVIAMASTPSYDPNTIETNWKNLLDDKDAPLINRAAESVYPPGSTFKVFTLLSALDSGTINESYVINCSGAFPIGKYVLHEAHGAAHGTLDYPGALIYSCNIAFADIALKMEPDLFLRYEKKFGLGDSVPFDLPVARANISPKDNLYSGVLAQSGFGQGEIAVTPLQMALTVSAAANEGKIMRPTLLKEVKDKKGNIIFVNTPKILYNPIGKETAQKVKQIMLDAVERGTGGRAIIEGVKVAGKTGTAENPHGKEHAWFIGFAPYDNPEVLVCVVIEQGGYGGVTAAPIAREIMKEALKK